MSERIYRYDIDFTNEPLSDEEYDAQIRSEAQRIGGIIYMKALSDRRGFSDGQLGITDDHAIWREIFENIGEIALTPNPSEEERRCPI